MRNLDRVIVLGGLLTLGVIGAALVRTPDTDDSQRAADAGRSSVIREGVVGTVRTLDPLFASTEPERDIDALLFRGLTRLGPDGQVVADLAQSWQIAQNGQLYTFTLRDDVRWHDGTPVTADDVVFTVLTLQHPDYVGPAGAPWRGIVVERLGPRVVRFRLPARTAGFPLVATQALVPAHLLSATPVGQLASSGFGQQPVGNGAFRLAAIDGAGAELVTVRSLGPGGDIGATNGAVGQPDVRARVDRYRFRFFGDSAALAEAFKRGELDILGGVSADTASALEALPGVHRVRYPRALLTTVVLNLRAQQTTAFRDARVRRALLLAIDRKRMLAEVLHGQGTIAETPISPASFAYDEKAAGTVPYDMAAAAKLLRDAGWKRTAAGWLRPKAKQPVEFELSALEPAANRVRYAIAEQVAADWRKLGLKINVKTYSTEQLAEQRLLPGRYFAAVVDVNLGLDPDLYPLLGSTQAVAGGTNLAGYQSRALDAQLEAARAYADPATRRARFVALQRSLAGVLPILPLFFADYQFVVRDSVVGPTSREIGRPSDRYWDVLTWRLADEP